MRRIWLVGVVLIAIAAGASGRRSAPHAAPPSHSAGQLLFIDPATGLPRDPTPQELQALQPTGASLPPEPIAAPDGMTGLSLTDDQMVYSVVTKNPDGTLTFREAAGRKNAEGLQAGREPRNDR